MTHPLVIWESCNEPLPLPTFTHTHKETLKIPQAFLDTGPGGGGGQCYLLQKVERVQGYPSPTQKYNQRKTVPKNIISNFLLL